MSITVAMVEEALREKLQATSVCVEDISGGCGSSFEVQLVVSPQFEGKRLLDRHKLVNGALSKHMGDIHALSIKKCLTPQQREQQQQLAQG